MKHNFQRAFCYKSVFILVENNEPYGKIPVKTIMLCSNKLV